MVVDGGRPTSVLRSQGVATLGDDMAMAMNRAEEQLGVVGPVGSG